WRPCLAPIRSPNMRIVRFGSVVALTTVVLLAMASLRPIRAQSLADVAKKEEDRRKQLKQPTKVYTNKDLDSVPPPSSPPRSEAAPSGAETSTESGAKDSAKASDGNAGTGPGTSPDTSKDKAKDPSYWAGRKKALQDTLDRDTSFADALQSKIN